jgi:hypothetical protein
MAKGNQYNEHWTFEEAEKFLLEAVELSDSESFDFIGEVAKKMKTYIDVFDYLVAKFPQLKPLKTQIKRNCETNCFANGKKGNIVPSLAIMNLKSNHGWTDRNTVEGGENPIKIQTVEPINWVQDMGDVDDLDD